MLQELAIWGTKHAMRPPLHDEAVHPQHTRSALTFFLNKHPLTQREPAIWVFRFPGNQVYTIRFAGKRWVYNPGEEEADIVVETTPQSLAMIITAGPEEFGALVDRLNIAGKPARVEEFISAFEVADASPVR